ncbi:MAG: hypothetical protein WC934_13360 [Acidithiobacillus sp.]|jgi:hypothetical protein|uniref:hypothetical protein n=1 Tax=Acidithiobacillus sp. TaxID=1872118 RepID=UPI003560DC84
MVYVNDLMLEAEASFKNDIHAFFESIFSDQQCIDEINEIIKQASDEADAKTKIKIHCLTYINNLLNTGSLR